MASRSIGNQPPRLKEPGCSDSNVRPGFFVAAHHYRIDRKHGLGNQFRSLERS